MTSIGVAMAPDTLYRLAPPLIALQFATLGWRANREINLGDDRRATFIPAPDVLNIMGLLATAACLIVLPIVTDSYFWLPRMVLGAGYVLLAFHPLTVAAHYRLGSRGGKNKYITDGREYPYATGEEIVLTSLSLACAVFVAGFIGTH
jgi:hypothetical protein